MAKRVLYLIRNGEYDRNAMDEDFNAPLTERGIEQAKRTARAIKDLPITAIFTSPHEQTGATAGILHDTLTSATFEASDELQQYRSSSVGRTFTREMLEKAMNDPDSNEAQIEDAFNRFFRPATDVDIHEVMVCHGNIILDLVCHATGVNPEVWSHMLINNCAINIIAIESADDMQLVAFNDVRHLPDNMRTE